MPTTIQEVAILNGKPIKDTTARSSINTISDTIGSKDDLNTTSKTLVGAINEVKNGSNKFSYHEGIKTASDADDNAVITRVLDGASVDKGSIFIVKTLIGADTYAYTGYVYNGTAWAAMDGNYSADNVYFTKDLVYTAPIGVLTVPTSGSGKIASTGKNATTVLSSILAEEKNPVTTKPSVSIKLNNAGAKEVGTKVTPAYVASFNSGAYTYDTSTGVTASGWTITDTDSHTSTESTGSFAEITVTDSTNYKVSATASYTDGVVPKTNIGKTYSAGQIMSGTTAQATSSAITGFRKYFYGSSVAAIEQTSAGIRGLTNSTSAVGGSKTFSMNIVEGAKYVIVAFPTNINKTLKKVEDTGAFGTDIVGKFVKTTVSVNGANNYDAINYDVYTYAPDTALGANKYNVTIG